MLREAGVEASDFEDLSTPQEKTLGALVKEKVRPPLAAAQITQCSTAPTSLSSTSTR